MYDITATLRYRYANGVEAVRAHAAWRRPLRALEHECAFSSTPCGRRRPTRSRGYG